MYLCRRMFQNAPPSPHIFLEKSVPPPRGVDSETYPKGTCFRIPPPTKKCSTHGGWIMKQVPRQPVSEFPLQQTGGGILKQVPNHRCFSMPPPTKKVSKENIAKDWRGDSETGCLETCFIIHPPPKRYKECGMSSLSFLLPTWYQNCGRTTSSEKKIVHLLSYHVESHFRSKKNHKTDQSCLSCCLHPRNEQANLLTACTQGSRRQDRFDLFCDSLITNVTPHGNCYDGKSRMQIHWMGEKFQEWNKTINKRKCN